MIRRLLQGLTAKERGVFEAYFFRQLTPAEIARLFGTTADNVYHSIGRARTKVREERTRLRLQEYVAEHKDASVPAQAVLPLRKGPGSGAWKACRTSFAGAAYALMDYAGAGAGLSLTDVMGLTAQAFRLTVEERTIDATGPSMYFWESAFRDGLLNLGFTSEHTGDGGAPPTPYLLEKGIAHIRRSIAAGAPVMAWDLGGPEFGLIYGYDEEQQMLYADDAKGKRTLPYDRLGRRQSGGLFILSITGTVPVEPWTAVRQALDMAVRHAYGERTFVGYAGGLAAYDCWAEAFRARRADPLGNAYTAGIVAEARAYAAAFLAGLAEKLELAGHGETAALAAEAAGRYGECAEALAALSLLFPFPSGGTPQEPEAARQAEELLRCAQAAETAGIRLLERLSLNLRREENRTSGGDRHDNVR